MADTVTSEVRSKIMSRVRNKDSKAEVTLRKALHARGFRYRVNRRGLPGTPDLVFPRFAAVLFVHGCFWHRHECCPRASMPSTRREFWESKFARTVKRDAEQTAALRATGWQPEVIWECETRDAEMLSKRLCDILERNDPE